MIRSAMKGASWRVWPVLLAVAVVAALIFASRDTDRWVKPRVGPIVEAIYSLGTVKSAQTWSLKAGITMVMIKVHVAEGDHVLANQPLLTTDDGFVFRAPFSGTVTKLAVQPGEVLTAGAIALTMQDLKQRYIQLSLDQSSALRVRPGQAAAISVESARGTELTGTVTRIYPSDSEFLVRVDVEDMPPELLPDMTADIAIEVSRRGDRLLIPMSSVRGGEVVVRRNGVRTVLTQVEIGAIDTEWVEILSNKVRPDDEVLIQE